MNNSGDITFTDAVDALSEDTARAKEILTDLHRKQSQDGSPGLRRPFADASQLPDEDKAFVQKYYEKRIEQVLSRDHPTEQTSFSSVAAYAAPPVSFVPIQNMVRDIKRLTHPGEQGTDANAYELMLEVLNYIPLKNFLGQFYYPESGIYRPISDKDLRSIIFPIVEHALAAGKNSRLIGNILDLLRDYPYIKVSRTTETHERVFFHNGAYNILRHELEPLRSDDFITSYIPIDYMPNCHSCPVFDDFLLSISV